MIIELAIGAGLLASGAALVEALRRRRRTRTWRAGAPTEASGPRGLKVGDVLVLPDGELWLAGALHLEEDGFVARLFHAPGDPDRWLAQLDPAATELHVLDPTRDVPPGPVADVVPLPGARFALKRRRPVAIRCEGEHLPHVADRGRLTELVAPGGRLLLVLDHGPGDRLALRGERLMRELADLLPGADVARE